MKVSLFELFTTSSSDARDCSCRLQKLRIELGHVLVTSRSRKREHSRLLTAGKA